MTIDLSTADTDEMIAELYRRAQAAETDQRLRRLEAYLRPFVVMQQRAEQAAAQG